MKQIALCINHYMNWYYFVKINKKSIVWQEAKHGHQIQPSANFQYKRQDGTIEEALESYKEDNAILMKFYE